ncbi:MAG: hypothetical protein ACUVXD_04085 [Thermodesulfobacteriota bacterium]
MVHLLPSSYVEISVPSAGKLASEGFDKDVSDGVKLLAEEGDAVRGKALGVGQEGGRSLGMGRWLCLLALVWVLALSTPMAVAETGPPVQVPAEFRDLYNELHSQLSSLSKRLTAMWDGKKGETAFGVELLVANSNRGEVLLEERVLRAALLTLDRLKELGVGMVALSIQYPMLNRETPRSYEYRQFYKKVVQGARARGYLVVVEMGTFFAEPEFTKYRFSYKGSTIEKIKTGLLEMAEVIVRELRPDYLTILSEPQTASTNTGLDLGVSSFAQMIRYVAAGLDRSGVKLGAGAGTWEAMAHFEALAGIPELDYLDLHIYPVHRDYVLDRVTRVAALARARGKRVSVGEAWLYKVAQAELGRIPHVEAFARDAYSFWQPLDAAFLDLLVALCHHIGAEFCSFFWMRYLYGYLDYDRSTASLSPKEVMDKIDFLAGQRILRGTPSETGLRLKALCGSN